MSQLDSELNALRIRLATLEEQKRIESETASEKKAFPLKTLEGIIDEKKKKIERTPYSKSTHLEQFYDRQTVAYLEPIFNMLTNIQERLDALERDKKDAEKLYDDQSQDRRCTFCGSMESVCGADHGDEMREIQREARGRGY